MTGVHETQLWEIELKGEVRTHDYRGVLIAAAGQMLAAASKNFHQEGTPYTEIYCAEIRSKAAVGVVYDFSTGELTIKAPQAIDSSV